MSEGFRCKWHIITWASRVCEIDHHPTVGRKSMRQRTEMQPVVAGGGASIARRPMTLDMARSAFSGRGVRTGYDTCVCVCVCGEVMDQHINDDIKANQLWEPKPVSSSNSTGWGVFRWFLSWFNWERRVRRWFSWCGFGANKSLVCSQCRKRLVNNANDEYTRLYWSFRVPK